MMLAHPAQLGYVPVAEGYKVAACIGRGAGSVVFSANRVDVGPGKGTVENNGEGELLLKVFREGAGSLCEVEAQILVYLAEHTTLTAGQLIPELVECTVTNSGRAVLVEKPVATAVWAKRERALRIESGAQLGQVVDIVQALHAAGVAHRDIKPSNVMFYDGHFLLADFDAACMLDAELKGAWRGTKNLFFTTACLPF